MAALTIKTIIPTTYNCPQKWRIIMYGQWTIDYNETIKQYGYNPDNLTRGSHLPVVVKCSVCDVVSNKRISEATRKHRCKSIIDNKKYCYGCKTKLDVSEFSKNRRTADGYQKICKTCFAEHPTVKKHYKQRCVRLKTDISAFLHARQGQLKKRSKKKNLEYSLPDGFLEELLRNQNGKCYYTKLDMTRTPGILTPFSISVDRLDNAIGYTPSNTVLCLNCINSLKSNMSLREFSQFLTQSIPALQEYIQQI